MPYAQYNLNTGAISATTSQPLSDDLLPVLDSRGMGQIEITDEYSIAGDTHKIDLETMQPVALPPPPPPPLGVLDHVFLAMVNKGEIDLSNVDGAIIDSLNASLKHYGKDELKT